MYVHIMIISHILWNEYSNNSYFVPMLDRWIYVLDSCFAFRWKYSYKYGPLFWCLVKGVRELPYFKSRIFLSTGE